MLSGIYVSSSVEDLNLEDFRGFTTRCKVLNELTE